MRHPIQVAQLYGLPHGILHVFNTILSKMSFKIIKILMDTLEITFLVVGLFNVVHFSKKKNSKNSKNNIQFFEKFRKNNKFEQL
jgi:hypothetical protein